MSQRGPPWFPPVIWGHRLTVTTGHAVVQSITGTVAQRVFIEQGYSFRVFGVLVAQATRNADSLSIKGFLNQPCNCR
ncbi:MAG: hypothetical protein CM1200mP18_15860 [Gammaproteobacteria bacterium]|nr:MAG: hypothetical protein CM1200mP18_15860 [Gammaproteobacteria bacterium]